MTTDKKETEIQDVQPAGLGVMLIDYRESAGYSLTQTADALCLSESIINHLENEEFDKLPEPPYVRGYLRGYAKIANKPADSLIATYEKLRGASPDELTQYIKPSSMSRNKPLLSPMLARLVLFSLLVAILGAISMIPGVNNWLGSTWNSFSEQGTSQANGNMENPLLTGSMPTPLPMPGDSDTSASGATQTDQTATDNNSGTLESVANPAMTSSSSGIGLPVSDTTPANLTSSGAVSSQTSSTINANSSTNQAASNTPSQQTNDSATQNPTGEETRALTTESDNTVQPGSDSEPVENRGNSVKIKLVFNEEVWLRIRDKEKKTVYEGQTPAGREKELDLEKPLTFRVGNAQGISIFVDGKPKDISSYIRGSIANFTIQ